MTPNARIQYHINQLDQQCDKPMTSTTTPLQSEFGCIFVNNNLKTMQLILLQNRCNAILKGRHTFDEAVFCNNLDFYFGFGNKSVYGTIKLKYQIKV